MSVAGNELDADKRARLDARLAELARQSDEDDDAPAPTTITDRRVDVIRELLVRGLWLPGETDVALGKQWGLKRDRILALAKSARMLVRREVDANPAAAEEILGLCHADLDRIRVRVEALAQQMEKGVRARDGEWVVRPDPKGAAYAYDIAARRVLEIVEITGVGAPKRYEHTGKDGAPLGAVDPQAAARLVREAFGDQARRAATRGEDEETSPQADG